MKKQTAMKSIYDHDARTVIINRIQELKENNVAQWGKMNAYQMLKHCSLCEDMFQGRLPIKRVFIGKLIGPMILKKTLRDEKPFGKNSPTSRLWKTTDESGDFTSQKQEWINRLNQYAEFRTNSYVHPFFGRMTREQIGNFVYKHADHHLRQFGA